MRELAAIIEAFLSLLVALGTLEDASGREYGFNSYRFTIKFRGTTYQLDMEDPNFEY